MVAADGRVFAIAEQGTIVGLEPLTGEPKLTIGTNYYYLYDLVATGGRVVVRTESEVVAAYDPETGEREGTWNGGVRRVAVRGDTLVFVTRYELVAIDLESGEKRWSVGKYSHAIGVPVIACDVVLVGFGLQGGQYENCLVAFDIDDGSERWVRSRSDSAHVGERCVVADRTIYIDDGGVTAIRAVSEDRDEDEDDDEKSEHWHDDDRPENRPTERRDAGQRRQRRDDWSSHFWARDRAANGDTSSDRGRRRLSSWLKLLCRR